MQPITTPPHVRSQNLRPTNNRRWDAVVPCPLIICREAGDVVVNAAWKKITPSTPIIGTMVSDINAQNVRARVGNGNLQITDYL